MSSYKSTKHPAVFLLIVYTLFLLQTIKLAYDYKNEFLRVIGWARPPVIGTYL